MIRLVPRETDGPRLLVITMIGKWKPVKYFLEKIFLPEFPERATFQ